MSVGFTVRAIAFGLSLVPVPPGTTMSHVVAFNWASDMSLMGNSVRAMLIPSGTVSSKRTVPASSIPVPALFDRNMIRSTDWPLCISTATVKDVPSSLRVLAASP